MCSRDNSRHIDVREDGTFVGLEDDEDATGNPSAIVPYDVRPDPIVSQHAVAPHAERTIVTLQTEDNADESQEDTTDALVQVHTPPQAHCREDRTLAGLESDEEGDDGSEANHEIESQEVQRLKSGLLARLMRQSSLSRIRQPLALHNVTSFSF